MGLTFFTTFVNERVSPVRDLYNVLNVCARYARVFGHFSVGDRRICTVSLDGCSHPRNSGQVYIIVRVYVQSG